MRHELTQDFVVTGGTAKGGGARPDFTHVTAWIFDLDNTLYPFGSAILVEAEQRICRFIAERFGLSAADAWRLQKECLRDHGSTLAGLVARFGIEPEPYLEFVNDVDVTTLAPAPELKTALRRLPGKRIVFTNNCGRYAERVLARLDIADEFAGICDIRTVGFSAKPTPESYDKVVALSGTRPQESAMFEDSARNLAPAHALGMTTVWLRTPAQADEDAPSHVHHCTDDLTAFLHAIEVRTSP